ncbi:WD repeat-containing protein 26 [Zancudomyces culisetae]|uniref:WD repeat-containing protein 26 n=1 Tax=Zancudomyces culisetae TaxID=1213189 RepID=A0A1R1PUE4_ZANCU|nr:WD repeat-containing protein 26 [Zancudomyces culisetae]|eukprot:OMH84571.1 WD repeat-containing protein 26 [Zancudomyces culisetae]
MNSENKGACNYEKDSTREEVEAKKNFNTSRKHKDSEGTRNTTTKNNIGADHDEKQAGITKEQELIPESSSRTKRKEMGIEPENTLKRQKMGLKLTEDNVRRLSDGPKSNLIDKTGKQREGLSDSKYKDEQLVRLMLQELSELGYVDTFKMLEQESGYKLESQTIHDFKNAVLDGRWEDVEQQLQNVQLNPKNKSNMVWFLIKRQQYLEAIEDGKIRHALIILQNELSLWSEHSSQLHELSRMIMCSSVEQIKREMNWDGKNGISRKLLLESLQDYIPSEILLGARRMETLIDQALEYQYSKCKFHITKGKPNLYYDHSCKRFHFHEKAQHILHGHKDEVWYLAFSNMGDRIASGSKDSSVIIWNAKTTKLIHTLNGHGNAISALAWSPDDKYLLSASNDMVLRLWDTQTGNFIRQYARHTDFVTACKWMPDGSSFISGGLDKNMFMWSVEGKILHSWNVPRIHDLSVSSDGTKILVADNENKILLFNFATKTPYSAIKEVSNILSISFALDSKFALVGVQNSQLHLWDLEAQKIILTYDGHKQGTYVSRCTFAAPNESLVVCGSADGNVHVWSRRSGSTIQVLHGHKGNVNCCAWSYSNKHLYLATASDDHTVRIWTSADFCKIFNS